MVEGSDAKVLTLKEVFSSAYAKKRIMCEFRFGIPTQPFRIRDIVRWLKQGREYGKTWRCWSKCPTDEQRKSVCWD